MDYSVIKTDKWLTAEVLDCLPSMPSDLQGYVRFNIFDLDKVIFDHPGIRKFAKYNTLRDIFDHNPDYKVVDIINDWNGSATYQAVYNQIMTDIDNHADSLVKVGDVDPVKFLKTIVNSPSYTDEIMYELEDKVSEFLHYFDGREDEVSEKTMHTAAVLLTRYIMPWKVRCLDVYTKIEWMTNNGPQLAMNKDCLKYNLIAGIGNICELQHASPADINDIAIQIAVYFHMLGPKAQPRVNRFLLAMRKSCQSRELVDAVWRCWERDDTLSQMSNLVHPEKYGYCIKDKKIRISDLNTINGYSIIQNVHSHIVLDSDELFEITEQMRFITADEIARYIRDDVCGRDIEFSLSANDVGNLRNSNLSVIVTVDMNNGMNTKFVAVEEDRKTAYLLYKLKFQSSNFLYGISLNAMPDHSRKIISIKKSTVTEYIYKSGL